MRFKGLEMNHYLSSLLRSLSQSSFAWEPPDVRCTTPLSREEEKWTGPVQVRFLYSTLLPCYGEKKAKEEELEQFSSRFKVPGSRYFRGYTEVVDGLACVCEQEGGGG